MFLPSIVLERQPAESNVMQRKPRSPKEKVLSANILLKSAAQGFAVFAASFGTYYDTLMQNPAGASVARSMGLGIIIIANLLLVQVNSSDTDSIFKSLGRLAKDKFMWAANLLVIAGLCIVLYTPLGVFLKLAPLSARQLFTVIGLGAVSVLWYEIVKFVKRIRQS